MTTRVGSATGSNTATMPAHAVGDLIVALAFRDGSTTAPTIPSEGWTPLAASNASVSQSGTSCSAVFVAKIADSTSENVGTFTNATFVGVVVYRAASDKKLGIGTWALQAGTAASVTYSGINQVGAPSWVGAMAGHRSVNTNLQNAPTGMSNVDSFVDATNEGAIHDTNGTAASWSSQNVAVGGTASGWITAVYEIREYTDVLTRYVAARDHPTDNALVIGIGHSLQAGAKAAATDGIKGSYLQQIADAFTACHAASSDSSFMGDQNITANGISPAVFNTNLTLGTFAAYLSDSIPGARAFTPSGAGTLAWNPDVAFDRLQVFYVRYSGSPNYTVNVDGGSSLGTLNMNNTPSLFASETFSVSDTTHQVRFVASAINGFINGAIVWRSSVKQITFLNAAWCSGLTTDFLVSTQPYNPLPALRTFGNVAATIIHLDANEILNSIGIEGFRYNLAVLTFERLFYGAVILVSSAHMNPSLGFSEATQAAYHNVVRDWATLLGCAYVRGTDQPGLSTYAAGNALGLYDIDGIHMPAAGYAVAYATPLLALLDATASTQTLTPSLLTNSPTFYAPTVTRGAVTLSPSLLTNSPTFYGPTINPGSVTLTPGLFTNSPEFYAPTVTQASGTQTLTPSLFTNTPVFYAATVSPGAVSLSPGLLTNTPVFYGPTVAPGSVTLSPGMLTNTPAFYSPTVTPGAVTLAPGLLTNAPEFYSPTVTQASGNQTLSPGLFVNTPTFYPATVLQPSLQTLLPGVFVNQPVFFPPAANQNDPPGTYPLAIEGGGTVLIEVIGDVPTVVGGSINFTGSVVAGALRGRS